MSERRFIPGFTVDNYRGVWERPKTFGAPRIWAAAWLILVMYAVLLFIMAGKFTWIIGAGLVWFAGQFVLVTLTVWDPDWDRLLLEWLKSLVTRKNAQYLRAG